LNSGDVHATFIVTHSSLAQVVGTNSLYVTEECVTMFDSQFVGKNERKV